MIVLNSSRPDKVERSLPFGISRFEPVVGGLSTRAGIRIVIETAVACVFEIDAELLRQPTRGQARVAAARQVAMYVAHVGYGFSLTEVGDLFERDRTTVAHACRVIELRRDQPGFDQGVELLELIVRVLAGAGRGGTGPPSSVGGK